MKRNIALSEKIGSSSSDQIKKISKFTLVQSLPNQHIFWKIEAKLTKLKIKRNKEKKKVKSC